MGKLYKLSFIYYVFSIIVFGNATIPTQLAKVFIFGLFILSVCIDRRYKGIKSNGYYIFWNIFFFLICLASINWSIDKEASITDCQVVALCNICNISVFYFLTRYRWDLECILKLIIICALCSIPYYIITNGFSAMIQREDVTRNANEISMIWSISVLICFYLSNTRKFKDKKILLTALFLLIFILLTGSKKALFVPFWGMGIIWILGKRGKSIFFAICGFILLAIIAFYLLMNVPVLYQLVGERIEGMINGFSDGDADSSTQTRMEMITYAIEIFSENIWLGIGIGSIDKLIGTYAHNNFVELLSCVGILGTLIFYSIYLYLFTKFFKLFKKDRHHLAIFCIALLLCYIVSHYGMIAYYDYFNSLIITILASILCLKKNGIITKV